jgi:hypothetical protein
MALQGAFSYTHRTLIVAYAVTAVWDVVLRGFSTGHLGGFGIERWRWVAALSGYFDAHTLLGAAAIAGGVGAVTYAVIATTFSEKWAYYLYAPKELVYTAYVACVSAAMGFPMRLSGLFPLLEEHYYRPLGSWAIASDAFSGIVVMASIALVNLIIAGLHI